MVGKCPPAPGRPLAAEPHLAFRNYEQIVKAHRNNPHEGKDQVSDQVKFNVFQGIMDSLFQSFNASISVASFQELSACVFSWIEEHCKPQVRSLLAPAHVETPGTSTGWGWDCGPARPARAAVPVFHGGCSCCSLSRPGCFFSGLDLDLRFCFMCFGCYLQY